MTGIQEALVAARDSDEPETREELYRALLDATLLLPVSGDVAPGQVEDGARLDVPVLTAADGRSAVPVFTSEESLAGFDPDQLTYVSVPGRELFRMLGAQAPDLVVVDPAGPVGLELAGPTLAALVEGRLPEAGWATGTVPAGTQLRIGVPDPDRVPVGLVPAARDALAADPDLVEGYLLTVASEGSDTELALGIVFEGDPDEERVRESFAAVAEAIRSHVPDAALRLLPIAAPLREQLSRDVEPLYEAG